MKLTKLHVQDSAPGEFQPVSCCVSEANDKCFQTKVNVFRDIYYGVM